MYNSGINKFWGSFYMDEMELYLKKYNFEKQLEALKKELKNKTIIVYGTGALFQAVLHL